MSSPSFMAQPSPHSPANSVLLFMAELVNVMEPEDSSPMIDEPKSVLTLLDKYSSDSSPGFIPGIHDINKRFSGIRKVRGDGNCFYRAFLFGYLDNLLGNYLKAKESDDTELIATTIAERARLLSKVEKSMAELIELGYSEFAIEVFYDVRIISSSAVLLSLYYMLCLCLCPLIHPHLSFSSSSILPK